MNIEIREDHVLISGYVNAVERYSKPIVDLFKGKIRKFVERIKAGVFKKAIERNKDVKVLLNHNHERELANTADGTATLTEDTIGLKAEVRITDGEIIQKAKNGELVGWSFGFYPLADEESEEGGLPARTVTDLDLVEVSILDNTTSPAYYGTSIEARSADSKLLSIRNSVEDVGNSENEKGAEGMDFEKVLEAIARVELKLDELAGTLQTASESEDDDVSGAEEQTAEVEEEQETEAAVESEEETEEADETENRSIDYSSFEQRIAKLS